ncbi:amino acid transport protein [Planctomycetales bacterium ZRK34]|nr:amino acid transport protein [Planctomycetales bacterium ZRK34]
MDANVLLLSILFGSIGMGMLIYGRKQVEPRYIVAGVLLMAYPYFIPGALANLLVGVALTIAPFLIG